MPLDKKADWQRAKRKDKAAKGICWACDSNSVNGSRLCQLHKEEALAYGLERNYGITLSQYDSLLKEQSGVCAICKSPPSNNGKRATGRLHVDHNHLTGKIRGLLCSNCNTAMGLLKDNVLILRASIDYILRSCS